MEKRNAKYIIQCEVMLLITAMKRSAKGAALRTYQEERSDPLYRNLLSLKDVLSQIDDLSDIKPLEFLSPFLEIISSGEISGLITGLALTAVEKFLNLHFLDSSVVKDLTLLQEAIETVANTVTHTKFVGTDHSSDEVILMKILKLLDTLMHVPVGHLISDYVVCRIISSCFRICFEPQPQLSELLRYTAECTLVRIVSLLFSRLPELKEDSRVRKKNLTIDMDLSSLNSKSRLRRKMPLLHSDQGNLSDEGHSEENETSTFTTDERLSESNRTDEVVENDADVESAAHVTILIDEEEIIRQNDATYLETDSKVVFDLTRNESMPNITVESNVTSDQPIPSDKIQYRTEKGIIFKSDLGVSTELTSEGENVNKLLKTDKSQTKSKSLPLNAPYGLACVQKLLSNLILILSPENHVDHIRTGLTLITAALESGADHISQSPNNLLALIQKDLPKHLILLLNSNRLSFFAASTRVCYLLFESMRSHLRYQMEMYLTRIINIITSDNDAITYDFREVALESLVNLWKIPGFITELYVNYDCDLFSSDLLQDLTELFCKIAMPDRSVLCLMNTQVIALDALFFMINSIFSKKEIPDKPVYDETDVKVVDNKDLMLNPILQRKKHLKVGTEKFNSDIKDGLSYLKENGFCQNSVDIALFLRDNPNLCKRAIGDLISNRKNYEILTEYLKLFDCRGHRIDNALRIFLEEFRLPGDSANIQIVLEKMSHTYFINNPGVFSDENSIYMMMYVIVMLNVDQHNPNSKKQFAPMPLERFKNLCKDKDKATFYGGIDEEIVNQIFQSIKSDEIVMPIEQKGIVKENYLWKQVLRRSSFAQYVLPGSKNYSYELFNLTWKSAVNAFVYIFESESDAALNEKIYNGLHQCASIAAYYNLFEIMDKIIICISKYTNFPSTQETVEAFARNDKTKLAAKAMFHIAQKNADILRDGWKNLLDCLVSLFKAKLLPKSLTEVDDIISKDKIILSIEEDKSLTKNETPSVMNWIYSLTSSDYSSGQRNQDDEMLRNEAQTVICECSIAQLIEDTRFLKEASLNELINALVNGTRINDETLIKSMHHRQSPKSEQPPAVIGYENSSWTNVRDEQSRVFCLELLMRVLLHNSDRIGPFLPLVYDHFYTVMIGAVAPDFLLERTVVATLRLTIQLLRKQDNIDQMFTCLEILSLTKMNVLRSVKLHVLCGLRDLLQMYAANIPSEKDWKLLFTLLEVCGAGTKLDPIYKAEIVNRLRNKDITSLKRMKQPRSVADAEIFLANSIDVSNSVDDLPLKSSEQSMDQTCDFMECSSRGYTSDSELYKATSQTSLDESSNKWILVSPKDEVDQKNLSLDTIDKSQNENVKLYSECPLPQVNQYNIVLTNIHFAFKESVAIEKACEILAYLVRDPAHITPTNFKACVHTLRVFAEACVKCTLSKRNREKARESEYVSANESHEMAQKSRSNASGTSKRNATKSHRHHTSETENEDEVPCKVSVQNGSAAVIENLSDLLHTLHHRADKIYLEWNKAVESDEKLWKDCWCPLLQGMARLCCDIRPAVRTHAMNSLQSALLSPVLLKLSGVQWEDCFTKVLFPLLSCFLETMKATNSLISQSHIEISDPRIRAILILTKVFLQHLKPLHELTTFTALWLTILEYMDSYMKANNNSDSLVDAVRESLKNVLLVMYTGSPDHAILVKSDNESGQLLKLTCDRLSTFLPDLVQELFVQDVKEQIPSQENSPNVKPHEEPVIAATQSPTPEIDSSDTKLTDVVVQ